MAAWDVSVVDRYLCWPLPDALTAIQPAEDFGRLRTARGEAGMPTQVKIPVITGPPALASRDRDHGEHEVPLNLGRSRDARSSGSPVSRERPRVFVWSLLPSGQQPG
jgi:hypothetical protein